MKFLLRILYVLKQLINQKNECHLIFPSKIQEDQ